MNAHDFIHGQTKSRMLALGYTDSEATEAADVILTRYKQNRFNKATEFLVDAEKYARQQYGPAPAKQKKK